MSKLYLFEVSKDGKTWTDQWLTEAEAEEYDKHGYIVRYKNLMGEV